MFQGASHPLQAVDPESSQDKKCSNGRICLPLRGRGLRDWLSLRGVVGRRFRSGSHPQTLLDLLHLGDHAGYHFIRRLRGSSFGFRSGGGHCCADHRDGLRRSRRFAIDGFDRLAWKLRHAVWHMNDHVCLREYGAHVAHFCTVLKDHLIREDRCASQDQGCQ